MSDEDSERFIKLLKSPEGQLKIAEFAHRYVDGRLRAIRIVRQHTPFFLDDPVREQEMIEETRLSLYPLDHEIGRCMKCKGPCHNNIRCRMCRGEW